MENYTTQLNQQVKQIEEWIHETDKRIQANAHLRNIKICVTNRKNGHQYYEIDENRKRSYIPKEKAAMVKAVAQLEYDQAVRKALTQERNRIIRFLKTRNMNTIENVYNNLCEARKVLVDPIIPTDKSFIEEWKRTHLGQQNDYPAEKGYLTDQGEMVRSKSEKILADLFLKHGIPYTYEPRIILSGARSLCPDFALLNTKTRRTIYWEHFGLISDGEYAYKAFSKLRTYEDNGLEVGKDILFSIESDAQPLDQKKIEAKIKKYLL